VQDAAALCRALTGGDTTGSGLVPAIGRCDAAMRDDGFAAAFASRQPEAANAAVGNGVLSRLALPLPARGRSG